MAEEFETRVPSNVNMWTVNTLNTDSMANRDLFKDLEEPLPEITTLEELMAYVQETIIRFDTAPRNYKKDDYKQLFAMVNRAMFYIYRRDPEITKVLNGIYYVGAASLSTDPVADKVARGYNNNGIYTANVNGVYTNFGVTVTEQEAKECITFLVPVFDGTSMGTTYTKVVYQLPRMATLYGDRPFDSISFNLDDPLPTLLAGQMAWNSDEGTLVLGMNGGDVMQSIGLELYYRIKASATITNGQLLMSDGTDGNSGVIKAKPAEVGCDPKYIIGFATEDIAAHQLGFATWFGKLHGINTLSWAPNTELYQSTTVNGGLQSTKPAIGNKATYAMVINQNANVGTIFVRVQRSLGLSDLNNVHITNPTNGQPIVYDSVLGGFKNADDIILSSITPKGTFFQVMGDTTVQGTLSVDADLVVEDAIEVHKGIQAGEYVASDMGFKVGEHTNDDFIMAGGGTLPITILKSGIYQVYKPDGSAAVLEVNAAGQVLINSDIIQNGSAYKIDAEEVTTKEQQITLRSDATLGMPIGDLAGFIIKLYDGVNDGMIVIDNAGTLRIGDVGSLQPVLTREELDAATDYSPLFLNKTTAKAETLPGTTTKATPVDADSIVLKDSADSYKPKWLSWSNIKATMKSYMDTLYVALTGNQTIAGIKTYSSSPKVPLTPVAPEDVPSKSYVDSVIIPAGNVEQVRSQETLKVPSSKLMDDELNKLEASTDTRIDELENVLNSMNQNQETRTTTSGVDTVSLPKTAANTGMQVQMFGQSAQQLVTNGNFAIGTTGWGTLLPRESISIVGGKLRVACVTSDPNLTLNNTNTTNFILNNKYFVYMSDAVSTRNYNLSIRTNPSNVAYAIADKKSAIITTTNAGTNFNFVFQGIGNWQSGEYIDISHVKIINLTATYGAGNEPTKEQCDLLFANYFEGTDNVLGTGRISSPSGKNLFDKKRVQYNKTIETASGSIVSSAGFAVTGYIPVKAGIRYQFSGRTASSFCFYNKFKQTVLSSGGQAYIAPANSEYLVLNLGTNLAEINTLQVEVSSTATAYEPYKESSLYITTPPLRSNGLIKDEIRKGTNGYELVKRVGVGTLGSELITNAADREFTSDTGFWIKGTGVTINDAGSGTAYIPNTQAMYRNNAAVAGKVYRIQFTIVSGAIGLGVGGFALDFYSTGEKTVYWKAANNGSLQFQGRADSVIDNVSFKELNVSDGAFTGTTATELGSNINYTLATPVITPIAHAGLLNSNANGTAYFEPIVADAGVYSTKIDIQLTDYPISLIESIRKYANGTYTELNTATAVIAGDGLSFTHPDLASGDLVGVTYAYANESIGRSMTLSYAISNSNPYYNITNSVPLTTGFYTSTTARLAVPEGVRKTGLILTYETAAGVWYTERYIGTATDTTSFTTASNWEVGVLRIASVTDTTEYAEITI